MKKISNVEVKLINLQATDVIATSDVMTISNVEMTTGSGRVGGRDYYDEEEW